MKQTNKNTRSLLLSSLLLASATVAGAAVTNYAGTFSATFPTTPTNSWETYQGIPAISGSWSFTFDDSVLVSGEWIQNFTVDLDTFSLTPGTINLTEFNLSNTQAELTFVWGELSQLFIGERGNVTSAGGGRDSFAVAYDGESHEIQFIGIGSATTTSYQSGEPSIGSFNPGAAVPEPSSSLLAVTAVAGLLLRRSRRA